LIRRLNMIGEIRNAKEVNRLEPATREFVYALRLCLQTVICIISLCYKLDRLKTLKRILSLPGNACTSCSDMLYQLVEAGFTGGMPNPNAGISQIGSEHFDQDI